MEFCESVNEEVIRNVVVQASSGGGKRTEMRVAKRVKSFIGNVEK